MYQYGSTYTVTGTNQLSLRDEYVVDSDIWKTGKLQKHFIERERDKKKETQEGSTKNQASQIIFGGTHPLLLHSRLTIRYVQSAWCTWYTFKTNTWYDDEKNFSVPMNEWWSKEKKKMENQKHKHSTPATNNNPCTTSPSCPVPSRPAFFSSSCPYTYTKN